MSREACRWCQQETRTTGAGITRRVVHLATGAEQCADREHLAAPAPWPLPAGVVAEINAVPFLRGLHEMLSGTTSTGPPPIDPDEPYDPADDPPYSMVEQVRVADNDG